MSETATAIAPALPRRLTRIARQRDERVRRLVRAIKKSAPFVNRPHYAPLLRIYAGLVLKYEALFANITEKYGDNLVDEAGHSLPAIETLQRLGKTCASIGAQLGLSPPAEKALRHNAERAASWDMWLKMAEDPVELEPAPADSAPAPEAANGATHASDD